MSSVRARWEALARTAPWPCDECDEWALPIVEHGELRCMGCAPSMVTNPGRTPRQPGNHWDYRDPDARDDALFELYFGDKDW